MNIFFVPFTQDKARSFIRTSTLDFFPSLIKPKQFIDTVENLTIFIDEKKDKEHSRPWKDMLHHKYNSSAGVYAFMINLARRIAI